jgi:hypothetical protein
MQGRSTARASPSNQVCQLYKVILAENDVKKFIRSRDEREETYKSMKIKKPTAQSLVLICPATDAKKMLEEGGEADDNGDEEPIEIAGKRKSNAVKEEIKTWIYGTRIDESKAAVLAATTDIPDESKAANFTANNDTEEDTHRAT